MEIYGKITLNWKKLVIHIEISAGLKLLELGILLSLALNSDIRSRKIRNRVVLPFIGIGAATNLLFLGCRGLLDSFMGAGLPVLLLFSLFTLKMLGAGDIKLFAAVGSVLGWKMAAAVMVCTFMSGGMIAALLILKRGNARQRARYLYVYLRSCILSQSLLPYTSKLDSSGDESFSFAWAVVLGTCLAFFFNKCYRQGDWI